MVGIRLSLFMASDYTSLSRWVRGEMMPATALLTKMRERITGALDSRIERDADGRQMVIPADTTPAGAPNRDLCRGIQEYLKGFKILIEYQQKCDQMVLMARNRSQNPMSEDEYVAGMAEMMSEVLTMISPEDMIAELKRRSKDDPKMMRLLNEASGISKDGGK